MNVRFDLITCWISKATMKTIPLLLALLLSFNGLTQLPVYIENQLQSILDNSLPATTNPGAVMTVYVPGQWAWSGATGYSITGVTGGTSVTAANPSDFFRVGSISKTFTSVSILQLYEAGFLNLNDPIDNYLRPTLIADTIQSSGTVTIRQLLDHTSGIANSADNMTCQQEVLLNLTSYHSIEDNIYCGASQGELFSPGSSWYYSNTNYGILAMIVEEVTGDDYWTYVTDSIITPLGLANTLIPTTNEIQGSYMGCNWNFPPLVDMSIIHPSIYKGWADVVSTTQDLVTYFEALNNGQLMHDSLVTKMLEITAPANNYSLGLEQVHNVVMDSWGHSGNVGNTSGMFFVDLSTAEFPEGYYIAYNFNYQGVNGYSQLDFPVHDLLENYHLSVEEQETNYLIYPNPADESVMISGLSGEESISLIGFEGKKTPLEFQNGNIDLSKVQPGLYFVEIRNTDAVDTKVKLWVR